MLKALLDAVMDRRAQQLLAQVDGWLPARGRVLDVGSGTGHFAAAVAQEKDLAVFAADVSDFHVTGPRPVLIGDGALPFADDAFSAALLFFMLAYPADPEQVLREAARVSTGPVIVVQSLYGGRLGRAWHGAREFFWTVVAFHASRMVGYVPRDAVFSMDTRRFYTVAELQRLVTRAGLRVRARRERAVLPRRALVVAAWRLERDV